MNRAMTAWLCAAVVGSVAIATSLETQHYLRAQASSIHQYQQLKQQLNGLAADAGAAEAASQLLAKVPPGPDTDLDTLLARHRLATTDRKLSSSDPVSGRRAWTTTLAMQPCDLNDLLHFIRTAATSRPPWTLLSVDLRAASSTPGNIAAQLTLQQLRPAAQAEPGRPTLSNTN